jgi:uncharacterized membrane protein
MKPRWIQTLLFTMLLLIVVTALRFALATKPGLVVLAAVLVGRLLRFLYESMHVLTVTLWDTSASAAEAIQMARERRAVAKEARHAARLL